MRLNLSIFKSAFEEWQKDKVSSLSAALSYYSVFSAAPLLLLIVSIAGLFLGTATITKQIILQTNSYFGPQVAEIIQGLINQTSNASTNIAVSFIGILTLVIGASGVFSNLKESLNVIFEVKQNKKKDIFSIITQQSSNFIIVLLTGFLLILFLLVSASISIVTTYYQHLLPYPAIIIYLINIILTTAILTTIFNLVYMTVSDKRFKWSQVYPAGLISAIMFTLGKEAIYFYIIRFSAASTYGAAGSVIIFLLWVFYSAHIFFYGAELVKCMNKELL